MVIHSDSRGSNSGFWRYHRSLGLIFFASMNQQVPTIQSNANASDFTFTREEFESAPTRQLLRDGRAANAIVWRLQKNGITWTVKDFSKRSWFVRTFIGPFLIRRELAALSRLKNINGIAGRAFRIDRSAMAVEFLEGDSLERIAPERITVEYLRQLEDLISVMHSRGVVHLDLRAAVFQVVLCGYGLAWQFSFFADQHKGFSHRVSDRRAKNEAS